MKLQKTFSWDETSRTDQNQNLSTQFPFHIIQLYKGEFGFCLDFFPEMISSFFFKLAIKCKEKLHIEG